MCSSNNQYILNAGRKLIHWGIYASEDTVYHLVNIDNGQAIILSSSLREASQGGKCRYE
jgi:hypothetical protein